jgi:hypothetical protein
MEFRYLEHRYRAVVCHAPEDHSLIRIWFPELPGCETRVHSGEKTVTYSAALKVFERWIEHQVSQGDPIPNPAHHDAYPWRDVRKSSGYLYILG